MFCRCTSTRSRSRTEWPDFFTSAVFEFLRQFWIAEIPSVEIGRVNGRAVLDHTLSQVVQVGTPLSRLRQIFSRALRHKNMSRISAIHDLLRHVNASACNICPVINVLNLIDRAAMNPHPQFELWMFSYLFRNGDGAINWCFRTVTEDKRHSISTGKPNQASSLLRGANLFGATDNLFQSFLDLTLLV